jgi:hypothetical protein
MTTMLSTLGTWLGWTGRLPFYQRVQNDDTIGTGTCPHFSCYIQREPSTTAFPEAGLVVAAIATQLLPLTRSYTMPLHVAKDVELRFMDGFEAVERVARTTITN